MDYTSTNMYAAMPPQKVSKAAKTKQWGENCVGAVNGMGNSRFVNGRTSWARKQTNYDLVNSIFDENDFKSVLDPFSIGSKAVGKQPAQMRDINLIVNKINLMKGDELSRPFNFSCIAVNGNAVSEKEKTRFATLQQIATHTIAKAMGLNPEKPKDFPEDFGNFERWSTQNIKDIREEWGNHILNYLNHKESLPLTFSNGWEHALIAAEEIYYVGITNGQPKVRACNPLNCEYDRNPDDPCIENGDWFREDRWMTTGQILDEFGDVLTAQQIDDLDKGNMRSNLSNQMLPGYGYTIDDINKYEKGSFNTRSRSSNTHHLVTHCVWKSMMEIGFLSYPDPNTGEMQEMIVGEDFKLSPEMKLNDYTLEMRWIPQIWHGTQIAADMVVQVEALPNQYRHMDNPSEVKLPYVGRIYNGTNSMQTSLVDLLKPHQYLYNIIWFRLEAELAKAKGKGMVMDTALIPKSEGIDMEKWMYFFDNLGVAFINSFEEGEGSNTGKHSSFNQFQQIDRTISQSVGQYIQILSKIESLVDRICGISPQREGDVSSSDTVGGIERSLTQSSKITEPWFYIHNEIKKKVLTQLLEAAKYAYQGSKAIHYILDDIERIFMEIDMDKFCDSDYGVFISNSPKDIAVFSNLQALASIALQSDKASLSDIIKMYKATSPSELENQIIISEQHRDAQKQQEQQMQSQMQQQQIQAQAAEADKVRAFEADQNERDRINNIQVAALKTSGFDTDTADNGEIDVYKEADLILKQGELQNKQLLETTKMNHQSSEAEKDRNLAREEMRNKKQIEDKKASVALKNKVAGEQ